MPKGDFRHPPLGKRITPCNRKLLVQPGRKSGREN